MIMEYIEIDMTPQASTVCSEGESNNLALYSESQLAAWLDACRNRFKGWPDKTSEI